MTEIAIKELKDLCTSALLKTGISQSHSDIVVDHYLQNELCGKTSHGLVRVVQIIGFIKKVGLPQKSPETIIDKGNIVVIDGQMNLGPVVGKIITDESIIRAKKHGLSFVGVNHYFGNTGSMAYYLRLLAKQNLIGFMSCNSESMVAAPAGKDRLIGTNPIGLGIPSKDGNHFIADFATSAIAYGKVLVAKDKGEELPQGCIIDKDGNPSMNPDDAATNGAILPLADYRGFALGLFVEMIGLLIGGDVIHNHAYGKDGLFIIAIDPSKLNDGYNEKVMGILNQIRASTPAPSHNNVSVPGDRSFFKLQLTLKSGVVKVTDKTLMKLRELA